MLGPVSLYINVVYISWTYKNFENTVTRAKISALHKDDIGFKSLPMCTCRINFYLFFNL